MQKLIEVIREYIAEHPQGVPEYQLIQYLLSEDLLADDYPEELRLFYQHFTVMHCLYHLQADLQRGDAAISLEISPLKIQIISLQSEASNAVSVSESSALREYYMNIENLKAMNAKQQEQLLTDFWKSYSAHIHQDEAFDMLALPQDATKAEIKSRYKALAAKHHPDKGGDSERFQKIRSAYEKIKHHW